MKRDELVDLLAGRPLLTRKDLARRFNRCLRTIDQWHADGILPKPVYLRGCAFPFWRPNEVLAMEKKLPSVRRAAKEQQDAARSQTNHQTLLNFDHHDKKRQAGDAGQAGSPGAR